MVCHKITNDKIKRWVKKSSGRTRYTIINHIWFVFHMLTYFPNTSQMFQIPWTEWACLILIKHWQEKSFKWKIVIKNWINPKKFILMGERETVRVSERALAAVRCVVWSRGDTSFLLSCCSLVSVSQLSAAELLKHSTHITACFFDTSANKYTVTLREVVSVVCDSSLVALLYRSTTAVFFWVTCKFSCETEDE